MTTNQRQALRLAENIRDSGIDPANLSDTEWNLLLLAAGLNKCHAAPLMVAGRILDHALRHVGYFEKAARKGYRFAGREEAWDVTAGRLATVPLPTGAGETLAVQARAGRCEAAAN